MVSQNQVRKLCVVQALIKDEGILLGQLALFEGSVWLSAIVYMIRSDADPTCLQRGAPLEEKVPYLEFCTPANYAGYRAIDQLTQLPPGRAFFSHLSYEALPPSIPQSKTKVRK